MADEKTMTRAEFEAQLVKRAWAEPEFKKKLLTNPREAIEEELRKTRPDVTLPANIQYYVHEETPNSLHITLPINPAEFKGSKEEWDNYAQGGCILIAVVEAVAVAVAVNIVETIQTIHNGAIAVELTINTAATVSYVASTTAVVDL